MISNFAVLPANGWIHCCGESKSAEDEDAVVVDDVADPKTDDIGISVGGGLTNIVGFNFFPESDFLLPSPTFDISQMDVVCCGV